MVPGYTQVWHLLVPWEHLQPYLSKGRPCGCSHSTPYPRSAMMGTSSLSNSSPQRILITWKNPNLLALEWKGQTPFHSNPSHNLPQKYVFSNSSASVPLGTPAGVQLRAPRTNSSGWPVHTALSGDGPPRLQIWEEVPTPALYKALYDLKKTDIINST